jgi:histidyl-tRNA synthetase
MIRRQYVLDKVRKVFELCGFDPVETPAFEEWQLLAAKSGGGEAIREEVYYFKDKSDRELGLRFDLTVPTARVIANNPSLPKPFKRYQIGNVWRYDRPGAGRYREFTQADVDIFACSSIEADTEIIFVAATCLSELGFNDFVVRVNSRKLIEELILEIGIEQEDIITVFRIIDKLDKIGEAGVKEELIQKGLGSTQINRILSIITSESDKIQTSSDSALEEMEKLQQMLKMLDGCGYKDNVKIDLSLVRGLEYYTGIVFEVIIKDAKSSIAGGGRYDKLIELYGGNPTPAVGISLGIERIVELMKERDMFNDKKTYTKIFVISIGKELKVQRQAMRIVSTLRSNGIATDYDIMSRNLSKQLDYAANKGISYVIFVGEKELEKNVIKLRNMQSGDEQEIKLVGFDKEIEKIVKK